jgi:hypothetical protein
MSRIVKVMLVLAGFGLMGAGAASAHDGWGGGHRGHRGHGGWHGGGWGSGYSGGWGSGYSGGFSGRHFYYGGPSHPVWHDTSHLHYYGPTLQRHGNHYHYIPAHTHIHRGGHWHR